MRQLWYRGLIVLGLCLLIGAAVVGMNRSWFAPTNDRTENRESATDPWANRSSANRSSTSGHNPKSEQYDLDNETEKSVVASGAKNTESQASSGSASRPLKRTGVVKRDDHPQVTQLHAELNQSKPLGKARSSMKAPDAFSRDQYFADPEEYLNQIRPGRVFQPAQPSDEVVPLAAASKRLYSVLPDEQVILRVKAGAGYPVSFYTPQVGQFSNRLKTITVAANDEGIAEATFQVGRQVGLPIVDVLAASPLHSGQVQFRVRVSTPQD